MARMTGNCDTTWFGWVLVLPVAASRGNQIPAIFFNQLDDFPNRHRHSALPIGQCSRDPCSAHRLRKYTTIWANVQKGFGLHVIPQHQLLRVRMQVHLLVHPIRHREAVQVMLQQHQRHDQGHKSLPVVLDEAQQLQPALGRPCPRWTGDSSGSRSGAGARSHACPGCPSPPGPP